MKSGGKKNSNRSYSLIETTKYLENKEENWDFAEIEILTSFSLTHTGF